MDDTVSLNNELLRYGRVNKCVGTLQLRALSTGQLMGGMTILLVWGFVMLFFGLDLTRAFLGFIITLIVFLIWGGTDFTQELEKWVKPRKFYSEECAADQAQIIPPAIFDGPHYAGDKHDKLFKWERNLALRGYVSYDKDRSRPGIYVLETPSTQQKIHASIRNVGQSFFANFCFEVRGVSPSMSDQESMIALQQLVNFLKSFFDIEFRFYWDCFSTSDDYVQSQRELLDARDHDPLSTAIITERAQRTNRLRNRGQLSKSTLRIYARKQVVLGGDYTEAQTWKDRYMAKVWPLMEGMIKLVTGKETEASEHHWIEALDHAYFTCYQRILSAITANTGLGLEARGLTVDELFAMDWQENHASEPPEQCPRYTSLTKNGLRYIASDEKDIHISSILYTPEKAGEGYQPAVPVFSQTSVYLPLKQKWAGCLRIDQQAFYPADDDSSVARGHLRFLWHKLQGVKDFRVISETIAVDPTVSTKAIKDGMQSRTRRVEEAFTRKKTRDYTSAQEIQDLEDAGRAVESNDPATNIGTVIRLYRDTEAELDEDLGKLRTGNFSGDTAMICQSLMERRYLESLPYSWGHLLVHPYNRRQEYLSSQAVPLVPITQPQRLDSSGILFTGKGIPEAYLLDFLFKKNHSGIFAKSSGGKSMLLEEIILECVFNRVAALVRDSPRGSGQSTFTPLIRQLQALGVPCVYHDIRRSRFNLIGFVPGYGLDPETILNHISVLKALVTGTNEHYPLGDTVESLLSSCHKDFFQGVDTLNDTPTLSDFYTHFLDWSEAYKNTQNPESKELDAISDIKLQLRGTLDSEWGQRLNSTESLDPNNLVTVLGLTNAKEDSKETLIYALVSSNLMDNLAAKHDHSLEIVDEGTTIIRYKPVAQRFERRFSEGRKEGCNAIFAATDLDNFWNSPYSQAIAANFDNILVGYTNEKYREKFCERLGFKPNILAQYKNLPDKRLLKSSWYLKRETTDDHIELEYSTTPLMLALGATEPDEMAARDRVMARFDDPLDGFKAFALELVKAYTQGLNASVIQ